MAMAADRAALFIDSRDVLAAPTAVLLEHALDAGHTPEDDLGRKTYRQLSSEIAQMDADMKRICAEHGIKPHPLKQWEGAVQVGPSTDCATERMGRLLIAYADGMAAIEGRRRRTALFLAEFQEVVARASEIEPNGSAYQRYTMLAENKHADAGAAPLSASRVAHALLVEMRERGVAKFKKSPEELGGQFAGLSTVDVTLLEVPGSLKTLGLLAAEYVGLVYAAKDAPYHISRDLALDRVKTRLARTRDVAYGLVSELDMVHAPDDDPVSRTVNYVLRDASSVLTVMDKEIKKADRLAKRYRRRIA